MNPSATDEHINAAVHRMLVEDKIKLKQENYRMKQSEIDQRMTLFKTEKNYNIKTGDDIQDGLEPYVPSTFDEDADQGLEIQKKMRRLRELKKNKKKKKKLQWIYHGF